MSMEGERSVSPLSREEWRRSRQWARADNGLQPRSRSRSPDEHFRGRRPSSKERQMRYEREGTNTTSRQPHMERARLFVGNINHDDVDKEEIAKLFGQYGEVLGVSVHKGFSFVQMGTERQANRAANFLDGYKLRGSEINVEFSQAALKAGAKFEPLSLTESSPPPPPISRDTVEAITLLNIEREREERIARILQMEKELAYLRSQQEEQESRRELAFDRGASDSRFSPPHETSRDYLSHREQRYPTRAEERRAAYLERHGGRSASPPYEHRERISYPHPSSHRQHGASASSQQHQRSAPSHPSTPVGYGGSSRGRVSVGKPSVPMMAGGRPPTWQSSDKAMSRQPYGSSYSWN